MWRNPAQSPAGDPLTFFPDKTLQEAAERLGGPPPDPHEEVRCTDAQWQVRLPPPVPRPTPRCPRIALFGPLQFQILFIFLGEILAPCATKTSTGLLTDPCLLYSLYLSTLSNRSYGFLVAEEMVRLIDPNDASKPLPICTSLFVPAGGGGATIVPSLKAVETVGNGAGEATTKLFRYIHINTFSLQKR